MYAMFGFLFINVCLMTVVVSLLSTIQTYFLLIYGNYQWWWRSFSLGIGAGAWMSVYVIWYAWLNIDNTYLESALIYTVYMYVFVSCFTLMCGAISVLASYYFIQGVYKRIDSKIK